MGSEQKRAFIAVVLSGIVLFTWQFFFAPKMPETSKAKTEVQTEATAANEATVSTNTTTGTTPVANVTSAPITNQTLNFGENQVELGSDLMVHSMTTAQSFLPFSNFAGEGSGIKFEAITEQGTRPLNFTSFVSTGEGRYEAQDAALGLTARVASGEHGKVSLSISGPKAYRYRITFKTTPHDDGSKHHRQFMTLANSVDRTKVGSDAHLDGTVRWLGLDYNYHFFALSFPEKIAGTVNIAKSGEMVLETAAPTSVNSELVYAKKNYDDLMLLGNKLELAVDFGFWGILAVPILRGLQFFHRFIPNYGISIILLTIAIRLLTFPLQYKSFKSMKKMQAIQPELNKLKEKFKDDPQRMQKETMELFKKAGANPLGGCLPLLMQMPVFIAFYKVLYEAVELVGAPFLAWIHDLSVKDPYFILPVLMTATMFIQQKLTPSASADPSQQKIMMVMPLVFGFIMKDLPAGLVLYIFVSTLMGIGQQLLVNKSKTA